MKKGQKVKPGSLKGGRSQPASKSRIGAGKRFAALTSKLEEKGAKNPKGLAAALGRAKFGAKKMASLAGKSKKK